MLFVRSIQTFKVSIQRIALLDGNADENQEASDASHAAPEFIEFFTSVMQNGDLARPIERYQCKLYAGFRGQSKFESRKKKRWRGASGKDELVT
jgi:hypothetical protein